MMGMHEVTQDQYQKLLGKNPSVFVSGGGRPVENVTWEEAAEFCRLLSELPAEKNKRRLYRLPTEAEWEYACRAGTTTATPLGDDLKATQANFNGKTHAKGPFLGRPTDVGQFVPNAFGLHDMLGNVWEWCGDWFDKDYYRDSPAQDPRGPTRGSLRVLRGSGWGNSFAHSATRDARVPAFREYHSVGIRVVCEIRSGSAPSSAVANGTNLLLDPSFENTALTLLPRDWRAWLNDGQEFRCEVVNGGHTGQRCLQISGKGTRGVVFANDIKVDRTKRYSLKGWAKFEGDKDARAIIKFNYFRDGEFLGAHDLVGVTVNQPGWHLLEKTDALDAYPQANHFYAMCHVEGSGTGWFDDLELVAYDRDKLPIDFDSRYGRNNRLSGPHSLDRWVGAWETQYVFRETDNSPNETKLTMNTNSERMLGDYFMVSHSQAKPDSPEIQKSAPADLPTNVSAVAGAEKLLILTFDQNLGAFRQWLFSSNGRAYESRGQWDEHQLTPRERMELFVPVCQAIQHAHQKGIIHRDLKPSNVMIASYDGRPVPKVIDFGVAKAMGQQPPSGRCSPALAASSGRWNT